MYLQHNAYYLVDTSLPDSYVPKAKEPIPSTFPPKKKITIDLPKYEESLINPTIDKNNLVADKQSTDLQFGNLQKSSSTGLVGYLLFVQNRLLTLEQIIDLHPKNKNLNKTGYAELRKLVKAAVYNMCHNASGRLPYLKVKFAIERSAVFPPNYKGAQYIWDYDTYKYPFAYVEDSDSKLLTDSPVYSSNEEIERESTPTNTTDEVISKESSVVRRKESPIKDSMLESLIRLKQEIEIEIKQVEIDCAELYANRENLQKMLLHTNETIKHMQLLV